MIDVICHTCLDLHNEKWPNLLPALPRVGDKIQSATRHKKKNGGYFQLELEVCSVTWVHHEQSLNFGRTHNSEWTPKIELHMCSWQRKLISARKSEGVADGSITAFYEWYAPLVGKCVGNFI